MPQLVQKISSALHITNSAIGVVQLRQQGLKTSLIYAAESPLLLPLASPQNYQSLKSLIRPLQKQQRVAVSLAPDYYEMKIMMLPTHLSKQEQKKYLQHQFKLPENLYFYYLSMIPQGEQKILLGVTISQIILKAVITLVQHCRLTLAAILITPIIIRDLLPHKIEQQLFILQQQNSYCLGLVAKNTLQYYEKITTQHTLPPSFPGNIEPQQLWSATENEAGSSFIMQLEETFKIPATPLSDLLIFMHQPLSPTLLNAAFLAYRGLNANF